MRRILYLLSSLEDADIEWFVSAGDKVRVASGRALIEVNVAIDYLYIVLDGCFSVRLGNDASEIGQVRAGEVLGEVSLLDSRPPVASVVALEDSVVLQILRDELRHKLQIEQAFAARFYYALGRFLAHRQRSQLIRLGYGGQEQTDENLDEESLDPELLDSLSLAGRKFGLLLRDTGIEPPSDL
jgi:CRP/FNR family transcriptional regulator, cyclic AMP receptor protein